MTDSITLQIDHMAYGGDAIGRYAGKAIFVPGGIAGETVRAEIVEEHDRFSRARLIDVLEASPHRVQPRCPHFDPSPVITGEGSREGVYCGGCQWQHISYEAQLQFKAQIVREQFQRIGKIDDAPVRDAIPSPNIWAYRNHARFSQSGDGRLGFQAAKSNRVVPIDVCYIVEEPILKWLQSNEPANQRINESANLRVNSVDDQIDVRLSHLQLPIPNYQISPDSFFQVNSSLIGTLVEQVMSKLDPQSHETILDAYCGVGLFTRFIAPKADRVIGIESNLSAIKDAKQNLREFKNVKLQRGLVEKILRTLNDSIDAVVVDPPRSGCGPKAVRALIDHRAKRIAYVSCDPSTLARDAKQMIDGGYRLIEVQPIDLFPQTYHIECVTLFVRPAQAS